jgi:5'-nucleotidase
VQSEKELQKMTLRLKHCLAAAGLALGLASSAGAQAATTTVKIIGFNDFHGNLNSPGTFSGAPSGGADYLAGYIADLKSQNPYNVVVEAGDVIGASPLVSALFHDEGTIETLNRAGLNIASVGNHEFDEGSIELQRMQNGGCHPTDTNSCKGASVGTPVPFEGAKFKYSSANVTVAATGKTLFPPYIVKIFGGVRVGFIGMTLKDTPSIVTPTGVAGLSFSDEVTTVNALVPKLRGLGVEAIVVVVHQGGFQGSDAPNFINDCSLKSGGVDDGSALAPLRGIVAGLDDAVDLVISGHTHTGYNCRLPTKNPNHLIPVTQASNYGRVLTDINMTVDNTTGDVTGITANNIVVSRSNTAITPSAQIASIVAGYNTIVSPLANQVLATITGPATNTANTAGEMGAGDLIADAQLAATASAQNGGAVIAFMNAGGVRFPGLIANSYPHDVTYGETFTVQPFGNSLVTMTLTAQQIKDVLEQQFPGCLGQSVQRVMQISNGFSYSWSASAAPCHKIVDVTLNGTQLVSSGVVLSPTTTYRIECNNFMSTGGDGFTVFQQGQNQVGGAQDIDALVAYLANFLSPNPPYDPTSPALHRPRITMLP